MLFTSQYLEESVRDPSKTATIVHVFLALQEKPKKQACVFTRVVPGEFPTLNNETTLRNRYKYTHYACAMGMFINRTFLDVIFQ